MQAFISNTTATTAGVGEVIGSGVWFAGGGGGGGNAGASCGGSYITLPGDGGKGGGGDGSNTTATNGDDGLTNTGGGGGGGSACGAGYGGAGGSGVVILKYDNTVVTGYSTANFPGQTCDFPSGAGAIALYQLNSAGGTTNNVPDTCGSYNGTGTAITYSTGKFGNAAVFDGTSSYIDIGGTIANSQSNLTVSMWLYWDGNTSNANDYFILLGNSSTGTAGSLFACNIITASGILRFYNGSTTYDSTSAISANTWTQIAITYASSGDLKFYINGNLDASHSAGALSLGASSNRGLIGGYVFGANPVSLYYGGSIDQVRIYNTALSATQVLQLYTSDGSELLFADTPTSGTNTLVFKTGTGTISFTNDTGPGAEVGMLRYNTTLQKMEHFNSGGWKDFTNYCTTNTCDYPTTATSLYQFDGDADDTCGNFNGTNNGATFVTGKFDKAASFNGSSAYIGLPNGSFQLTTLSISAWINPDSTSSASVIFETYGYQSGSKGFLFRLIPGGQLDFSGYAGDPQSTELTSSTSIPTGTWTHVVVVFEAAVTGKLYINKVEPTYTTQNVATPTFFASEETNMGALKYGGASQDHFDGLIDQVRVFPTVLTSAQVTELYDEIYCT